MTVPAYLETHMAIVGTTGAGKTVTGKGYVEQLLDDGRQVIVVDPTGAWWGMQSNATGDGLGYKIPIFGGLHGNAPLDADDGVRLAELLIERRVSAIVDLSELGEEEQRAFSLAFIARLRTKPIGNLHLVIDEADELAPELVPDSEAFQLKRALAWIAKRGRIRGFVLTVITQRPADLAKSVLALAQTMVVHRLIAPQDQAPVDRYLKGHATAAVRKGVLGSLAGLKRGERWIYSPVDGLLERGTSPTLRTFDSSAAPIAGQEASEPQALADVDFAALAEALAADRPAADPIAAAEAEQPGAWDALVARVAALEAKLAAEPRPGAGEEEDEEELPAGVDLPAPIVATRTLGPADPALPPRQRRILAALGWCSSYLDRQFVPRRLVAWAADTTPTSSTFERDLGVLRREGLIDYPLPGELYLTDAGLRVAPPPDRPRDRAALWALIRPKLPPRQARIVEVLWPGTILTRAQLAGKLATAPASSTYERDLGALRSLGLIAYPQAGTVALEALLL